MFKLGGFYLETQIFFLVALATVSVFSLDGLTRSVAWLQWFYDGIYQFEFRHPNPLKTDIRRVRKLAFYIEKHQIFFTRLVDTVKFLKTRTVYTMFCRVVATIQAMLKNRISGMRKFMNRQCCVNRVGITMNLKYKEYNFLSDIVDSALQT